MAQRIPQKLQIVVDESITGKRGKKCTQSASQYKWLLTKQEFQSQLVLVPWQFQHIETSRSKHGKAIPATKGGRSHPLVSVTIQKPSKYQIIIRRIVFPNKKFARLMEAKRLTLSKFCSFLRFAMPPQNREDPRTKRRFESIEPSRLYFTTSTLCWTRAKMDIMSSVAFPHVAFRSPPTAKRNPQQETESSKGFGTLFLSLHSVYC